MSTTEIPDVTVLAAIDRAERHRGRPGVPVWLIFEHLGIPRRSRRVRAQSKRLCRTARSSSGERMAWIFGRSLQPVVDGCKAPDG